MATWNRATIWFLRNRQKFFSGRVAPAYQVYLQERTSESLSNNLATAINDHAEWNYEFYEETNDPRLQDAKKANGFSSASLC
jgi:hypothetical protein